MRSERKRHGIVFRPFITPEGADDPEFAELERQEWEDPLAPVRAKIDYWSRWLEIRSLPRLGRIAVSKESLVWRELGHVGLDPDEEVMTAYQYLWRRWAASLEHEPAREPPESLFTNVLAAQAVESFFMATQPREKWEAAGYGVPHKPEADFRATCFVQLGWVLKELELREQRSPSSATSRRTGKPYRIEDDVEYAAKSRTAQKDGIRERQRQAREAPADEGVAEVEQRVQSGKMSLRQACAHVAKPLGIPPNTLKSRVSKARRAQRDKKVD